MRSSSSAASGTPNRVCSRSSQKPSAPTAVALPSARAYPLRRPRGQPVARRRGRERHGRPRLVPGSRIPARRPGQAGVGGKRIKKGRPEAALPYSTAGRDPRPVAADGYIMPPMPPMSPCRPKASRRIYDEVVCEAIVVLWEASDRICGKRLKALMPTLVEAMERHGHMRPGPQIRAAVLAMSASTIDRSLRQVREQASGRKRRRTAAPSSVRKSIPVRTFSDWDDPPPGFVEADLVAHCGPVANGSFVQNLTVTDIATGWTECAPLLYREQTLLREVLGEVRRRLPFELLGFDTDNDSVFVNETVRDYCRDSGVVFTRCRPWHKNDQAFVEQKNGAIVRRIVGYRRLEGLEAAAALSRFYTTTRLFVNFFQPSFKLASKRRDGARVSKRYHPPATPCQRLLADPGTPQQVRDRVAELSARLDPIRLLRQMRVRQQSIVDIVDQPVAAPSDPTVPPLEQFLAGLRVAWREGEARPTAIPVAKPKRGRRRPDPLVKVTEQLHAWFEAEPWHTSRQLFERLQAAHPGEYPDGLLRTVQRRVKVWRKEKATAMVFGEQGEMPTEESIPASSEMI